MGITAGPDGNLWFTEQGNSIGRITPAGIVTEFVLPTIGAGPQNIAAGPDGNLWFTELFGNKIGRITTDGVITEFIVPTNSSRPYGIAAGPDGNLWFTESFGDDIGGIFQGNIGRITTAGVLTEFTVPTSNAIPWDIAAGPDGNLWFTENYGNRIGRITTAGSITEFIIPTPSSSPGGIAAGSDGNLWFTEISSSKIGRITVAGVITEFNLPEASGPLGIAPGPDGNLWFTEGELFVVGLGLTGDNKIGRITPAGIVTEFTIPNLFQPIRIAPGPDGNLWFTEFKGFTLYTGIGQIVRLTTGPCSLNPTSLCLAGGQFHVQVQWATSSGQRGAGQPIPVTSNTGAFWFFDPTNLELVVKVLDGRSINGKWWIFYGSLTNVEFTLTVTDTLTGAVKTYTNPQGQLASVADTSAF